MANIYMNAKWHIVLTKAGCEKKVVGYFQKKQLEHYCPLNTLPSSDNRSRKQQEPLLKSYVFVRIDESQVEQVRKTSGVMNFVYWLNKPAIIKEMEIETIRFFLHQYQTLHIEKTEVNINENVKSIRASSITKEGNVTEMLHNSIKATLPSLGIVLIARIPENAHTGKLTYNNITYNTVEKQIIKEQF
ncbi:MAG: UpxY family transcription antiterminator [Chitinophagaceae bacterium]